MYWHVSRKRSDDFRGRSLMAFSYGEAVQLPGVICDCGTWAHTNLRYFPIDDETMRQLTERLPPAGPIPVADYADVRDSISDLLPSEYELIPGAEFGFPQLQMRGKLLIHLTNDIASESFRTLCDEQSVTGIKFHEVKVTGRHKCTVYAIEAEPAKLTSELKASCEVCGHFDASNSEMPLVVASSDVYRQPYFSSGFIVSDRLKDLLREHQLDVCLEFTEAKTEQR